ncbi:MAG: hypothetical protein OXI54_14820 [Chloroflexota bacterium]|nr:hypothetical protein [Chloroflexota bacterium]MDE2685400.1 hypothetical protein [Chloroflexota bacterium]
MWQNIKLYVLAYSIMVVGAVVSTAFQLLGDQFPVGHPVSAMAANLSGMSIGGLIMVLGFIRDGRVKEERQRTADAEARAQEATIKAATATAQLEREREQAHAQLQLEREWSNAQLQLERERAAAAEARAERLMDRYEAVTEALIRRLEERNGDGAKE